MALPLTGSSTALISGATAAGAGQDYGIAGFSSKTFQATVSGAGAVAATVRVEVSNDEVNWTPAGTISLSGTTIATDGFVSDASWKFVRGNVLSISGTGAAVALNVLVIAEDGTSAITVLANVQNLIPSLVFNKYRKALAKTRDGVSDTRVLLSGDSTFTGIGSTLSGTFPAVGSVCNRLATLLNTAATPAILSLGLPPSILSGNPDNRWVAGSGWTGATFGAAAGAAWVAAGTTGNLVYTPNPQVTCDGFYVYWIGSSGYGTLTATATGGTPQVINANVATSMYRTLIPAASAVATNTLTMSSVGQVFITAVEPVLSTKKQILVGNAGVGSSSTINWNSSGTYQGLGFISTVAPDLTIISLGINDAFSSIAPATYAANIQAMITAAQVSGDVLLMPPLPNGNAACRAYEVQYLPVLQNLAAVNNCAYLDIFNRWGGAYNANFMYSDQTHGTNTGYWDWAQFVANVIGNP